MHRNETQGENTLNNIHQIHLEKREDYEGKVFIEDYEAST